VIFYCASTTALHVPDWKFSEEGHQVKLGCKNCMKKVENHCSRDLSVIRWSLTKYFVKSAKI